VYLRVPSPDFIASKSKLVERLWLSLPGIDASEERCELGADREVARSDDEMTLYLKRSTKGLHGLDGFAEERKDSRA
jgi:hypothetical protein